MADVRFTEYLDAIDLEPGVLHALTGLNAAGVFGLHDHTPARA
jgi:hypothetical protein